MHHYITKYRDESGRKAVSWFQINFLGKCYCFFKKEISI